MELNTVQKGVNIIKKIIPILTVICLIIIGCENQEDSYADRESELLSLLDDDDALGLEGLDDGDAVDDEYTADSLESAGKINLGKVMEVFHPDDGYIFKFGRKITSKTKTITYTHGDDFSIADIIWTVC